MDNPKNAGMQKLTDKVLRGEKKQERKVSRLKRRGFVETVTTLDGDKLLEKRRSKKVKRKAVTSKGKTKRYATTKAGVDHTSIEMGK